MIVSQPLALVALFALVSCSFPTHSVQEERAVKIETPSLRTMTCSTHNGRIEIRPGVAGIVAGTATVTAWGDTDEAARATLATLVIEEELVGDELRLSLPLAMDVDGDVAFTLSVPPGVELTLHSHNGAIDVAGIGAALWAETHNGAISFEGANSPLHVTSHNGAIRGSVDATSVEGRIETHNGGVAIALPRDCGVTVEASSHNGSLSLLGAHDVSTDESWARGVYGGGNGTLRISTHNGGLRVETRD